jgi:hypothetical protein
MKIISTLTSICLLASISSAAEPSKEAERDQQQVVALAKEIQLQQAAMAENQAKIEAKTTTVAETLRQARIYASRGGGH